MRLEVGETRRRIFVGIAQGRRAASERPQMA